MNRLTVQLAYQTTETQTQRVLADSEGRIYVPGEGWTHARGRIEAFGAPFERWSDVPSAWMDGCVYWK
jgi:hypothetical protein